MPTPNPAPYRIIDDEVKTNVSWIHHGQSVGIGHKVEVYQELRDLLAVLRKWLEVAPRRLMCVSKTTSRCSQYAIKKNVNVEGKGQVSVRTFRRHHLPSQPSSRWSSGSFPFSSSVGRSLIEVIYVRLRVNVLWRVLGRPRRRQLRQQ